jgi:hypothetical protein
MAKETDIKLFENYKVRSVWNSDEEKWYISIVDVVEVLTESLNPNNYWKVLKNRLKKEGNELVTNCNQLKMQSSDGKFYKTDVADVEQLFRLIQSIPSPKTVKQYKAYKSLKTESLRDNMTNLELVLNMLAEATTTEISKEKNPKTFAQNREIAQQGGTIAGNTRKEIEAKTGKKIVTPLNAKNVLGIEDKK